MTVDDNYAPQAIEIETVVAGWKQQGAFVLEKSQARYAGWLHHAKNLDLLPIEQLLPRIVCPSPSDLPAFMAHTHTPATDNLRAEVAALEPWGFWFRLASDLNTKKLDILGRNRIICRSHLITATVERLLGKRLSQATVLDMACHSGFFTFDIASRGVQSVTGVELRENNVDQARFLQKHYGIDNADFEQGDVMTWQPPRQFSVVLNLGLLYHVIDPITLVRRTYDWCTDFAVIDTICHHEPVSAFIAAFNKDASLNGEGVYSAELHPTYRALIETMYDAGFVDLLEIVASEDDGSRVSKLYRERFRRCIVGFKRPMRDILAENGVNVSFMDAVQRES
jgi:predicted RNA methylase